MAITSNIGLDDFDTYVHQTDSEKTIDTNLLASTTGSVFGLIIENGTGGASFKMYDSYAPTYGTTAPDLVISMPADTTLIVHCRQGIVFSTALSIASSDASGTGSDGDGNPGLLKYTIFGSA